MTAQEYYAHDDVRGRMVEYCGGTSSCATTAAYVVGLCPNEQHPGWHGARLVPAAGMSEFWNRGCDMARSLWDAESLIVLLELDYQNTDYPGEPFLHPTAVFTKLEPAYQATTAVFRDLNLPVQPVVTGRGYQFVGRIPLSSPLIDQLASFSPAIPDWFAKIESRRPPAVTTDLDARQARAWHGLGLVVEHAAHLCLKQAAQVSPIPVVLNGTAVGSGQAGRECVSIDFSYVGDPLDVRHARIAFSTYAWHRLRPDIFGTTAAATPPLSTIPRRDLTIHTLLARGRQLEDGCRLASTGHAFVPDVARGLEGLMASYRASGLFGFHRSFYADVEELGGRFPPVPPVPPCESAALERPNDLLLKPEHLQHLVRGLMSRGWRPAEVAALVQAKYIEDQDWGNRWTWMDPKARAEFDVRVFAGLVATGLDTLVDFNCVSAQEKGLCPWTSCRFDLRNDRDTLLLRRLI